jgi:hypothetical protein
MSTDRAQRAQENHEDLNLRVVRNVRLDDTRCFALDEVQTRLFKLGQATIQLILLGIQPEVEEGRM